MTSAPGIWLTVTVSREYKIRFLIDSGQCKNRREAIARLKAVKNARHHQFTDREDGAAACDICKAVEDSLPDQCPGREVSIAEAILIYRGQLNFIYGEWVQGRSMFWIFLQCRKNQPKLKRPANADKIMDNLLLGQTYEEAVRNAPVC